MADVIDDSESFTIALTLVIEPAKGEIANLSYPASVEHGAPYDVDASISNVGGVAGTFAMELHEDGALKSRSPNIEVQPNSTTEDQILAETAPTSGTSMSIEVKCIRIV